MLELSYISLIVVQFAISLIVSLAPVPWMLTWLLFGAQLIAAIIQNMKFPCFAFRTIAPALLIMTAVAIL